jgi:serine/threonine protein kinase
MPKGDLLSYVIKTDKISMKQNLRWMYDISKGMKHLANQGIVHRFINVIYIFDIKGFGSTKCFIDNKFGRQSCRF